MKMFILNGTVPEEVCDVDVWMRLFDNPSNRTVRKSRIDKYLISTVFLGLDHSFSGEVPLLFETIVFDDDVSYADLYCSRCSTWEEAEADHNKAIQFVYELENGKKDEND